MNRPFGPPSLFRDRGLSGRFFCGYFTNIFMSELEQHIVNKRPRGCTECYLISCIDRADEKGRTIYDYNGTLPGQPNQQYVPIPIDECLVLPMQLAQRKENERLVQEDKEEKRKKLAKAGSAQAPGQPVQASEEENV